MKNSLKLSFVSLLISAGLLSNLSGCSNEDTGWIAEYNGEKTNVGVYINYMLESYNDLYLKDLMGEMTLPGEEEKKDDKEKKEEDKNSDSEKDKDEEEKNSESEEKKEDKDKDKDGEDKNSESEEKKEDKDKDGEDKNSESEENKEIDKEDKNGESEEEKEEDKNSEGDEKKEEDEKKKEEEAMEKKKRKTSIFKKMLDGKNGEQWIIDGAKDRLENHIAINQKFKDMKLELDKGTVDYLEHNLNNQWDELNEHQKYEKKGISKESILEIHISNMKKEKIFDAYYGKDGIKEVKDSDIQKYLNNNYNDVKYFSFELYGLNDDEKKKKEELFKEFLERAKAGEDFDELIKEYNKKEKDEDKEDDEDKENNSNDEKNEEDEIDKFISVYNKEDGSRFSKEIEDEINKADKNVVTGYKAKYEYIVFINRNAGDNDKYIEKNKENLINEMKEEEFKEEIKTWINKDEIKYNQDAIDKYTPSKLKLNKQRSI